MQRRYVMSAILVAALVVLSPAPTLAQLEQREIGPQRDAWMRVRLETVRNRYRDAKIWRVTVHVENRTQERRRAVDASAYLGCERANGERYWLSNNHVYGGTVLNLETTFRLRYDSGLRFKNCHVVVRSYEDALAFTVRMTVADPVSTVLDRVLDWADLR